MAPSKKAFCIENPALDFISTQDQEERVTEREERTSTKAGTNTAETPAPQGYKLNPNYYIETKSKRVQLLLQPSTVEAIKSLAEKRGLSMNEAINEAIQEYLHK